MLGHEEDVAATQEHGVDTGVSLRVSTLAISTGATRRSYRAGVATQTAPAGALPKNLM